MGAHNLRLRHLVLAAALTFTPVIAAKAKSPVDLVEASTTLKPNQGVWAADVSGTEPIRVEVSLAQQLAYVYRGDRLIGVATVSTGSVGRETPTGTFPILQKEVDHRSKTYDDAPMPYMQRLTWKGVALHAGHNPGEAASHGCVRMPASFAKKLFSLTQVGDQVSIFDDIPAVPQMAMADAPQPQQQSDPTDWARMERAAAFDPYSPPPADPDPSDSGAGN
ncbi:hypothetical protein HMF7854_11975 [Sphingomonas ginkgonis]|uniref:L,D-TPase catalytic domain-containing protein n=1 Tax=Sphingomonas ginkgonis TaxID=2315330 RepID=A0A429VC61_9SPHN|nr:L,D-transpeptidase family protein [Sphingomonas ginkgonis]RST31477.1 hypothetical protein HMF7854_11975 [Sphingomonas ginkgonis]